MWFLLTPPSSCGNTEAEFQSKECKVLCGWVHASLSLHQNSGGNTVKQTTQVKDTCTVSGQSL